MSVFNSRMTILCRSLPLALAVEALIFTSAPAHAAAQENLNPVQLDPITVVAPAVKIVGRDAASGALIEDVTETARVQADPAALRTNYGALMLKYSVRDAANKVCTEVDPFAEGDVGCVEKAIESAQPQVEAAIARARAINQPG